MSMGTRRDREKKKRKEWRLARVVPLPFSMKPSPLIKDATREPDNPFPRARASFSIASVQDTQTNQRVIGRAWTVLHVGFDFSKVDRKKKKEKGIKRRRIQILVRRKGIREES